MAKSSGCSATRYAVADALRTELNSGTKIQSSDKEYGFSVGGPINQNQLHFFFTYEGKKYEQTVAVTPA